MKLRYKITETAYILSISRKELERKINSGEIPLNEGKFISADAIRNYIRKNEKFIIKPKRQKIVLPEVGEVWKS